MKTITLRRTLPDVFKGMENEEPLCNSEVWLKDISFNAPEHYLVEAESGTGKSSLCSFIYGSRGDYSGSILFDNTDVRSLGVRQWCEIRTRHLAYLPQEMMLFGELTAMENIQIKNSLTGFKSREWIMQALEKMEIANKADVPASMLSVGQQQRVAIIRALCQPFNFLIVDEPVSHLDARNNATVAAMISEEAAAQNAGIISTSVGNKLLLDYNKTFLL